MSQLTKLLIYGLLALAIASTAEVMGAQTKTGCSGMSSKDWRILIEDIKTKNPESLKKLAADPALLKKQTESMRQLLAFACQAKKEGLADETSNAAELENIRMETSAMTYDQTKNKLPNAPAFSLITDADVEAFYKNKANDEKFRRFLESKVEQLDRASTVRPNVTPDEEQQAREYFAKISIYDAAGRRLAAKLGPSYADRVTLQVKLQQAQFLARVYSDKIAQNMIATDDEISKFVASHPELDTSKKKIAAQAILDRALAGENFAELADKYSEDPGNKNDNGEPQGGLYSNVRKGTMVKPFEDAALALEPGKISPALVESDFGYHIIKLEKKAVSPDADGSPSVVYDVRHILISTTVKDPANPAARELPISEYARGNIENEKERAEVTRIVAANPIQIAELRLTATSTAAKRPVRRRNR